ncbi:MAG: hypothetical protein N2255_02965 [Kiritimatiellae bacterium]|nr:hypothetical protein [Kiritimatiellia bacterium]
MRCFLKDCPWGVVLLLPVFIHPASWVTMADSYPNWWRTRNVVTDEKPNDFAAANQGQLKWIATNAYAELELRLPRGAGEELGALICALSATNNFAAVNAGQLKHLARLFYDRLIAEGWTDRYPWSPSSADDADFSTVNIGQLKNLFAFDLVVPGFDGDKDWLSDNWENEQFGELTQQGDFDSDGDGVCNRAEQTLGTDALCADSDGDGVPDGLDVNPRSATDSDGDGLSDDWERFWLRSLMWAGDDDPDSDGWSNLDEFLRGTDPARTNVPGGGGKLTVFRPLR